MDPPNMEHVMVDMPWQVQGRAWSKCEHPYFGPYEVVGITLTNAEVCLLNRPSDPSIFVSLDRVQKYYDELTNDALVGHGITPFHCGQWNITDSTQTTVSMPPYTVPVTSPRSKQTTVEKSTPAAFILMLIF